MNKPMISTKQLMGMQIALCPQGNWDDCAQLCLISMELSFKDSSFVLKIIFLYLLNYACDANAQARTEEKKKTMKTNTSVWLLKVTSSKMALIVPSKGWYESMQQEMAAPLSLPGNFCIYFSENF